MICFPNAKINLGLNVVSKRPDGYHNIETIFYPIPVKDALEIVASDQPSFTQTGIPVDASQEKNLVIKALNALKTRYEIPPLEIHLLKAIPFGAGLGGGSADAAFMLKLVNDFCGLDIHPDELEAIASTIGADCPFFIRNTPVFATGTGNQFEPVDLSLKDYYLCLVKPDVAVSTPEAYSMVTRHARDLLERDHPATGIRMERADGERFRAERIPETSRDRADQGYLIRGRRLICRYVRLRIVRVRFVRKTNPFQGTIPVQRLFSMGRTIIMNQIETFFDTMAERWDAVCVHDPGKIRTILDRTNLRQNARILDVGCGTGILESYLLPYEPRQIVAIDIAGQMIEKARVKYPDHPLIEFLQEDAMSYEGKGFDYIILYSAYPHFMRPERLIKHMSDLLVPGGKLVICHSESKEKINTHHHRHADRLSLPLPPAREVAALMEPYLLPLVVEDTEQLYIVCGKRLS